jgi:hypothetical protein
MRRLLCRSAISRRAGTQIAVMATALFCCGAVSVPAASARPRTHPAAVTPGLVHFNTGAIFSCFGAQRPFAGIPTSSTATIGTFAAPGFTAIVNLSGAPPFGARPNTSYFLQLYSSGCLRTGFTFLRTNALGDGQAVIHVDDPVPPLTHDAFAVASGGGQFLVTPEVVF